MGPRFRCPDVDLTEDERPLYAKELEKIDGVVEWADPHNKRASAG